MMTKSFSFVQQIVQANNQEIIKVLHHCTFAMEGVDSLTKDQ